MHSRNSTVTSFEVTTNSQETPSSRQDSVPVECPPTGNSRTLIRSLLHEPQEQVVIPSFSESDEESVVSDNRSLLLHHLSRQNRFERPAAPSVTSYNSGPNLSSPNRGSLRLIPRHLQPRTSGCSVTVSTGFTTSTGLVSPPSTSDRGPFAPLGTHARDFSSELEHISSSHNLDVISDDESTISLNDLFELEEDPLHLRRRSRTQRTYASLLGIRDSDSDSGEAVVHVGADGVHEMRLSHGSSHNRDAPGPSSSSSAVSLITISDVNDHGTDRSSTSVEGASMHVGAGGNLRRAESSPNIESRPEVIVVGDSSEDEEEVNK